MQHETLVVGGLNRGFHRNPARLGEFDGIADEV
jgi:hypothetical protein